jgi:serine/threonine protein kinase
MKQQGLRNRHIGHFIEEVQLINRLLHPSIVLYMGMCIYDDQYAMITEFLSNGSLFDYLHKHHKKLSQERTFYIIKDIALGMTYLHGKRVLHCDLKSSNVLID